MNLCCLRNKCRMIEIQQEPSIPQSHVTNLQDGYLPFQRIHRGVLFCINLYFSMTCDAHKLFMCLFAIHISSLVKYLFKSSDHFKILLADIIFYDTILKKHILFKISNQAKELPPVTASIQIILEKPVSARSMDPLMSQRHVTKCKTGKVGPFNKWRDISVICWGKKS